MFTKKFSGKISAFTLVEITIALTLFAVVASISMVVTSNILKTSKKIQAQIFLYSETEAIMDQLELAVQKNAVDYEAYFLRNVGHQSSKETGWATTNYGDYQQTFIDPGTSGIPDTTAGVYSGISGYGSSCSSDTSMEYSSECPTEIPVADSIDQDTGEHPYPDKSSSDANTYSNAFCEGSSGCTALSYYITDELILVNAGGDNRIIFVKQSDGSEYRVAKSVMSGIDSDGNGAVDLWECTSDYTCTNSDGGPSTSEFQPITPSLINILNFEIYISPIEDPYRAFAETAEVTQVQPQIKIILTSTLSDSYGSFLGDTPEITIQRTVSTGVYSKVESYEE